MRDYLLALDQLTAPLVDCGILAPELPALASHVAQLLGVSRASAGEMLQRLENLGLVTRTDGRQLLLGAAGRAAADIALYRQRIRRHRQQARNRHNGTRSRAREETPTRARRKWRVRLALLRRVSWRIARAPDEDDSLLDRKAIRPFGRSGFLGGDDPTAAGDRDCLAFAEAVVVGDSYFVWSAGHAEDELVQRHWRELPGRTPTAVADPERRLFQFVRFVSQPLRCRSRPLGPGE